MEKKTVSKGDIVIGQRIKKIREEKSMTQKKLAEKVMVSPSSIGIIGLCWQLAVTGRLREKRNGDLLVLWNRKVSYIV